MGTCQTGNGGGIDQKLTQMTSISGGSRMTKSESGSFEKQLEAARRASDIKKFLFGQFFFLSSLHLTLVFSGYSSVFEVVFSLIFKYGLLEFTSSDFDRLTC